MPGRKSNEEKRVEIVPFIHGKITTDGNVSEPDVQWMVNRWFERHPEFAAHRPDVRITRGTTTTKEGLRTDLIRATVLDTGDLGDYDPNADKDLYEYFLADVREFD
jgi:hypothetical protein